MELKLKKNLKTKKVYDIIDSGNGIDLKFKKN